MKKVLGITLVLVTLFAFVACDPLTSIGSFTNLQLEEIAIIGMAAGDISMAYYFDGSTNVSKMITVDDDDNPTKVTWNNFDFKKAGKLDGDDWEDFFGFNVIIKSGNIKFSEVNDSISFDLTFQIEGGELAGTYRVVAKIVDSDLDTLTVNGKSVETEGL